MFKQWLGNMLLKFFFLIITMFGFALIFGAALCFDDDKNTKEKRVSHNDGEFD